MPSKTRKQFILEVQLAPDFFLSSRAKPLLIDEWQHIYFIWDQIKFEVDNAGQFGQFILTGNVTDIDGDDEDYQTRHTGNERIVRKNENNESF